MTITKHKIQKFEYNKRVEKLRVLQTETLRYLEQYKYCYKKLKDTLTEYVEDFDPDRFYVSLQPKQRRILQRQGVLVNYLDTVNEMYDARNKHYSLNAKIKRIREVDFPEW